MLLFRPALCVSLLVPLTAADLAIRNVTVIEPDRGKAVPNVTLIVRGERIEEAGPAASVRIPKGARIIEGRGKFLIPGLWDMHVHLWHAENQLPHYVARGVTGVRDMGSSIHRLAAWRKEIRDGASPGPHIITSGPAVAGQPSDDPKLPVLVADSPERARQIVDELEVLGADFVKVLSNVPRDAYIALAERARQLGIDFAGHIPSSITAGEAVAARQNSIEHLFGLTRAFAGDPKRPLESFREDLAREFFAECVRFGSWHTPTLTLWKRMAYLDAAARLRDPRLNTVPAAIRAAWPTPDAEMKEASSPASAAMRRQFELMNRIVAILRESGAGILAGTDTGDPYTIPGATLHEELGLLVKAGLTPAEALVSATTAPARFLGWEESVGRLEKGFVADFVLLNADPLVDIAAISKVAGVSARGRWLGPAAISRIVAAPAATRVPSRSR